MNWITNYVRPKINSLFSRREMPENLWSKCDACGQMIFHRELAESLHVCPSCDNHMGITPRKRFEALFDGGVFSEIETPEAVADPLQFRDQKKYPDRMKEARKTTGEHEAMLVAQGEIGGVVAFLSSEAGSYITGATLVVEIGVFVCGLLLGGGDKAIIVDRRKHSCINAIDWKAVGVHIMVRVARVG